MSKTPARGPGERLTGDLEIRPQGDVQRQIAAAMGEIDVDDSGSIIFFGAKAQEQLTRVSDSMLEAVRVKDLGPAGSALGRMVGKLRELDLSGVAPTGRPNLLSRVLGIKDRVGRSIDQYEEVRDQIDQITDELEAHKTRLLTDITRLDKLYDANLDYLRTLEIYIAAGRAKLEELDQRIIPARAGRAEQSEDVVEAQKLRDLRAARDDLERRVHDLLLTRQVTMQALPGIRLVQENDKSLIAKINSTIVNTVPLWRQQLAQAITIYRAGQAGRAVRAASDLTNELLRRNAENLRQVNAEVRREVERGVFDIEVVRAANDELIATIQESLQIAEEGRARRQEAERQLVDCEVRLKDALASAAERGGAPGPRPPRIE
jgi:uncharacterized protein YaaN involved in tellurite resistance